MVFNLQNNDLKEKVKAFFKGQTWEKVLTFSFFLILSFGFWLLQHLQQKFEIDFFIPINYTNTPSDIILEDFPKEMNVRISDKGTSLLNYYIGKEYNPVDIDLKNINLTQGVYNVSKLTLEQEISKRLVSSTSLVSFFPESIQIHYAPLKEKEVPVVLQANLKAASGYMIDSVTLNPQKLTILGSAESLGKIDTIYTEEIELENINTEIRKKLNLRIPSKGIKLGSPTVELFILAEEYTEKSFTIPVESINLPSHYSVRIFPSQVEITCQLVLSKYSDINESDFTAIIDYEDMLKSNDFTVPIKLSKKPGGLKNYHISPERAEFLIEQNVEP